MPGAPTCSSFLVTSSSASSFLLLLVMPGAFQVLSLSFLKICRWFTTFFLFCADTGSRPELEAPKPHYWRLYIYGMLVCLKIPSTIFNPQSMMQPYVAVYQDKKWTRQKGMQKDAK